MKLLFSIAAIFSFNVAVCQNLAESDVPSRVLNTFQSEQPNVSDVEWEMEDDKYEVEFENNNGEHEMLIDKNGEVLMHKGNIRSTDLPRRVRETLGTDYADREIEEVEIMKKNGKTLYEVELDGKVFDDEILVSEDGKVQKSKESWYKF